MAKLKDLTEQKFERLTVLHRDTTKPKTKGSYWICICECEDKTIKSIKSSYLLSGDTKSCGCLLKEWSNKSKKKYNTYDLSGEYGIGYTKKGDEFYFDLEDYDLIKEYYWYKKKNLEYIEAFNKVTGKIIRMHRLVLDVLNQEEIEPDHIFHIKYDNRKSQLRKATSGQNSMNTKIRVDNKSGVKGVHWHKRDEIWTASIQIDQKQTYLGSFTSFEDAVRVRKEAEDKYYGEYSYDNSMNLNKNPTHELNDFSDIP